MVLTAPHWVFNLDCGGSRRATPICTRQTHQQIARRTGVLPRGEPQHGSTRSHPALCRYEDRLDKIESDPAFQKMMAESDKAIREGRVTPHSEVVRMSRARTKKRK